MNTTQTIAAVATPLASGGIGVIRISGDDALAVADKVFVCANGGKLCDSNGYRAYFGNAVDGNAVIDEAVCLVFRAPHSYTGEDVAEISLHGSVYLIQRFLSVILSSGARAAEPGEFTKRAFLNGKMDLSEAEAVMGIISARGEQAAAAALNALEGNLSREIHSVSEEIIGAAAGMAAWVDYPDDETEDISYQNLRATFSSAKSRLTALLDKFDAGQIVTGGIDAAIVGRPNVGKSTLMNLLTGYERSIVTSYAGTTRDVVEETVRLGNVVLRLADTAGIHNTDNPVESIGVELAKKKLARAALVLAVFDGSEALTDEDIQLLNFCLGKKTVAIINKTDLEKRLDVSFVKKYADDIIEISAENGEGFNELCSAVERALGTESFDPSAAMLATERQRDCVRRAVYWLDESLSAIDSCVTMDAVNVCADSCIEALLELTGEKAGEAVVSEIFSRFCVGK